MQEAAATQHMQRAPLRRSKGEVLLNSQQSACFPLWVLSKFALLPKRDKSSWGQRFPNRDAKRKL